MYLFYECALFCLLNESMKINELRYYFAVLLFFLMSKLIWHEVLTKDLVFWSIYYVHLIKVYTKPLKNVLKRIQKKRTNLFRFMEKIDIKFFIASIFSSCFWRVYFFCENGRTFEHYWSKVRTKFFAESPD